MRGTRKICQAEKTVVGLKRMLFVIYIYLHLLYTTIDLSNL